MTKDKSLDDKRTTGIICAIVAGLYTAEYFITGIFIFKNMFYTFALLPFLTTLFALLPLTFAFLNIFIFKKRYLSGIIIAASIAMAAGHFLFTAYVLSKLTFLLITGLPVFGVIGLVALFVFLVACFPKLNKVAKIVSIVLLSIAIFFVSVCGILRLSVFRFTSGAVVFAVEDEYQIAWSTSVKSTGSVTVGGTTYYDVTNGENNVCTLHKVSVPMNALDDEKSYTITSIPVYSEAAYLSISGNSRSKEYTFRPVDMSDGLQIYNISDNHETIIGASRAAGYFGDKLDVLILNGDIINDVTSLWQISLIYKLGSSITGGSVPVIYSRGNHECNGKYASKLADYVASYNGKLYYNVKLGDVFFTVLDTNNDMSDDNALISPAANFDVLREEQTQWLNSLTYCGEDCSYRFLIAHMAFALSDYNRFPEWTAELVAATDGRYDLCISGHSHVLDYSEAGTGTSTSYAVIRGSIRSNTRSRGEGVSPYAFTGTAVECIDGGITAMFTNSKGEVRDTISIM